MRLVGSTVLSASARSSSCISLPAGPKIERADGAARDLGNGERDLWKGRHGRRGTAFSNAFPPKSVQFLLGRIEKRRGGRARSAVAGPNPEATSSLIRTRNRLPPLLRRCAILGIHVRRRGKTLADPRAEGWLCPRHPIAMYAPYFRGLDQLEDAQPFGAGPLRHIDVLTGPEMAGDGRDRWRERRP